MRHKHWSDLAGNSLCATGLQQSPIPLKSANVSMQHVAIPSFHYQTSLVHMLTSWPSSSRPAR